MEKINLKTARTREKVFFGFCEAGFTIWAVFYFGYLKKKDN